jgi:hypothetical protein
MATAAAAGWNTQDQDHLAAAATQAGQRGSGSSGTATLATGVGRVACV